DAEHVQRRRALVLVRQQRPAEASLTSALLRGGTGLSGELRNREAARLQPSKPGVVVVLLKLGRRHGPGGAGAATPDADPCGVVEVAGGADVADPRLCTRWGDRQWEVVGGEAQ